MLNHFIIVLAPLAAILTIICTLWPAARRRLVWLVLVLAVVTVILTPVTTTAGAWLQGRVAQSPALDTHMKLGNSMIYFSVALLVAAVLLAAIHIPQARGYPVKPIAHGLIAVLVIAAALAALVQTYRIGESGARAAWGDFASSRQ